MPNGIEAKKGENEKLELHAEWKENECDFSFFSI